MRQLFQSWIVGALLLVIALVALGGAVYGMYHTYMLRSEAATLRADRVEREKRGVYAASVRTLLRETATQRDNLAAITSLTDAVAMVRSIEALADETRVAARIESVNDGGQHPIDKTLTRVSVSIRAEGTYTRLWNFMHLLESAPLPARVQQFTFEYEKDTWVLALRAVFLLDTPPETPTP